MTTQDNLAALEALVDTHGLRYVVDTLAAICAEKSEHLASNWQDQGAAQLWRRAADRLARAAMSRAVDNVTY